MFKKRFLIILVTVLALVLIGVSIPVIIINWPETSDDPNNHDYYQELTEFKFTISEIPLSTTSAILRYPSPILAEYIKQETFGPEGGTTYMAYIFRPVTDNVQMGLLIPMGAADTIAMVAGEEYKIEYQTRYGFPDGYSLYFLTIQKNAKIILLGLSDWTINYEFHLSDFLPIQVSQTRVLSDHYIDGNFGWLRMTNTEIMFVLDGESTKLYQGQSAVLGDYQITLLEAREIEYDPKAYDAGQKSISYVIYRNN